MALAAEDRLRALRDLPGSVFPAGRPEVMTWLPTRATGAPPLVQPSRVAEPRSVAVEAAFRSSVADASRTRVVPLLTSTPLLSSSNWAFGPLAADACVRHRELPLAVRACKRAAERGPPSS